MRSADQIFPGVSRLICVASKEFPRYSEADVIELKDGRLLLALGRKESAGDFAQSRIIGRFSRDRGVSWDEPHMILEPFADVSGIYSVGFCRTPRGIHMFFMARGPDAKNDTRIYQILSQDECKTWSPPVKVNVLGGYHVMNNARIIRTSKGRMIAPAAHIDQGGIEKNYDRQGCICYLSDDDGVTWHTSAKLSLDGHALMEPGVAECADGSLYMTIRTKLGKLYEARSRDHGETWLDFRASDLPAPAAPSTVLRDPASDNLWLLWCNRADAKWKQRSPQVFAVSHDHGNTWSEPRVIEHDPNGSFGYISVTFLKDDVLLTYYDWRDHGQPGFEMTSLRQRTIPAAWFRGQVVPPVFQSRTKPVLSDDRRLSVIRGVLVDRDRWRMWYGCGVKIVYAESHDRGETWKTLESSGIAQAGQMPYVSVHRVDERIIAYVQRLEHEREAFWRYVSDDEGKSFVLNPEKKLDVSSAEAFEMIRNENGTWTYYVPAFDDQHSVIERAESADGVKFASPRVILRDDRKAGDAADVRFAALHVFRYRGFHLGILQILHRDAASIQPEWAWSHDGENWVRTHVACIGHGDEGNFDCRIIGGGQVIEANDEFVYLYTGRGPGDSISSIGRATLARTALDQWLDTLPQP